MPISSDEMLTCEKCGKRLKAINFYTYKDGRKTELCKACLTMHMDAFNPETFLWALEKLDIPYVEKKWNGLRDKAYQKDPLKMNGMTVFGKYLSAMKLKPWKDYSWADNEQLAQKEAESQKKTAEEKAEFEKNLEADFQAGKISEAEYKTYMSAETMHEQNFMEQTALRDAVTGAVVDARIANNTTRPEDNYIKESELVDLGAELTHDDRVYLAMKWGRLYTPDELIQLEKNYKEMTNSFDINDQDTKNTLILLCKTNLKMNQAIDQGDVDGALKHSRMYDSLRKSAKFTAAQNKEEKTDFVESVGQIVAYCEKNGGQIPKFVIDEPLDKVDEIIMDAKTYTKDLIYEDKALARQIEDYLQFRKNMEEKKMALQEAQANGQEYVEISDEDFIKHQQMIESLKEQDAEEMAGEDE